MAATIVRRIINTAKAPKAIGPYNQAVLVDKTLYISGQIGIVPDTSQFVSDKVEDQTRQVMANLRAVLEEAGATFDHVVKCTVLFADLGDFEAVNNIYAEYFTQYQPARAAFQAAALPKGAKVEIEAVAVVGQIEDK